MCMCVWMRLRGRISLTAIITAIERRLSITQVFKFSIGQVYESPKTTTSEQQQQRQQDTQLPSSFTLVGLFTHLRVFNWKHIIVCYFIYKASNKTKQINSAFIVANIYGFGYDQFSFLNSLFCQKHISDNNKNRNNNKNIAFFWSFTFDLLRHC